MSRFYSPYFAARCGVGHKRERERERISKKEREKEAETKIEEREQEGGRRGRARDLFATREIPEEDLTRWIPARILFPS